jgi:hypothetical protein
MVKYTKTGMVCQNKIHSGKKSTRYDSALLILLSANRARRRTLMITDSNQAWFTKTTGCGFQEETLHLCPLVA